MPSKEPRAGSLFTESTNAKNISRKIFFKKVFKNLKYNVLWI